MRTWQRIGKICLKYCVLDIILAALMLTTTILPVMQPAMADKPDDIINQLNNGSTDSSDKGNGDVLTDLADILGDIFKQPSNISANGNDGLAIQPIAEYGQIDSEDLTLPMVSNSETLGEHVPVPTAQGNIQDNAVSPDETIKVISLVSPGQDASIEFEFEGKQVKLNIPQGAMNQEAQVEVTDHGAQGSIGDGMLSVFEMHAFIQENGRDERALNSSDEIKSFNKGLTFSIQHEPEDLAGLDLDTVRLCYLDENTSQWMPVEDCNFDPATYTLTATINHFSFYGEVAEPVISGPGRVLNFQTDLHSGAATYSYPIEVPTGSGGFQPNINLIYTSASVDEMKNKRDVGSWVGIGWSLGVGSISYAAEQGEYYLTLDGATSYSIVEDSQGLYHTVPESFIKITRDGQRWDVYDTGGTYYRFGNTANSIRYYDRDEYYRWDLDFIQDTNTGNTVNITYVQDIWEQTTYTKHVRAAYPSQITYNNNSIIITFNSSCDSTANGGSRDDNPAYPISKVIETRRLNSIDISVDGDLVRKYVFAYNTSPDYESDDYGGYFYAGRHTLTSITEIGSDGVSQLPATCFTYFDMPISHYDPDEVAYKGNPGNPALLHWPYLVSSTNGYGATVNYTYQENPVSWSAVNNTPTQLFTALSNVYASNDSIYAASATGQIFLYNGSDWFDMYSNNSNTLWDVRSTPYVYYRIAKAFAVGDNGTILMYDGSSWSPCESNIQQDLSGVHAFPNGNFIGAYAVGAEGTILSYNGIYSWSNVSSGVTEDLHDIYGCHIHDIYAVGSGGTILRFNGSWNNMSSGTEEDLYGVWSAGYLEEAFAVGAGGTILHWTGSTWSQMDSGTTDTCFVRVWGNSADDVFAAGYYDAIYHYNGFNWTKLDSGTFDATLTDICGAAPDKLYVSGIGSGYSSVFLKYPSVENMWTRNVVSNMSLAPGIGVEQTYQYSYTGDPQYYHVGPETHAWDDEFRGYPQVRVTDAEGNYTDHYFWTTGNGDAEILTGREYLTESYNSSDQLLVKDEYTWAYSFKDIYPSSTGSNIVGYWKFDENSGQTAADYSGYSNNGTLGPTSGSEDSDPSWASGGRYQAAIEYDGYDDYVNISYGASLNVTANFSIEAWVQRDSLATQDCIIAAGTGVNNSSNTHQWLLYVDNSENSNRICFEMGRFTQSGLFFFLYGDFDDGNASICDSAWHHVAVTFNMTDSNPYYNLYQCRMYVDGVKKAERTSYGVIYPPSGPLTTGITDCRIGSRAAGGDYFHGRLDDVRVYSRVLSPEEIQQQASFSPPFVYLKEQSETIGSKISRTRYVYDEYGNLLTQYNDGDISTSDDDSTFMYAFYPNTSANILNKVAADCVLDHLGQYKKLDAYYYDNASSETTPPSVGNPTTVRHLVNFYETSDSYYTYDIYGNVLIEEDPNGNVWQTTYDETYHTYPVNISSPMEGLYETYEFDPGTGNLLSRTDVNNQYTSYEHDVFGRLTKVIRVGDTNASPSVEYQYNDWGNLSQQHLKTLAKVNTSDYLWSSQYFDGFGRVIQTQSNGETGHTIIGSTITFNSRGLEDKVYVSQDVNSSQVNGYVTPEGSWHYSTSTYDALGRVIVATAADGTTIEMDYSVPWQTTVTNPNEFQHVYYYDAFNQLIRVDELDDTDELYATTTYSYDAMGNLVEVVDDAEYVTSMTYDLLGRKTAMSDPDMGDWSYEYDPNGNLISQTDNKSQTIAMNYDDLNRITAKLYPSGSGMYNVSYSYDDTSGGNYGMGKLTSIEEVGLFAPTTYQYDERGRLTAESKFSYFSTYYEYDDGDRLTAVTYPTGEVVTQTYNGRGLPNTLSGNVSGDLVTGTTYNELGQVTRIDYGNGDYDTYAYYGLDAGAPSGYWGRLWRIQTSNTSTTLSDMRYTWDANGNLLQRYDAVAQETETFTYDFLSRLKSVSGIYSASYSYDEIGNIVEMNDIDYYYNGSQPHAVTSVGNTSYAYDANGNMITRGDQTITWDMNNMPISVIDGVNNCWFAYDGNGNRVLKVEEGDWIFYPNQYLDWNGTSGEITSHYYLGGKEVAYKVDDDLRFVHQDHLVSTSVTTDGDGDVVAEVKYYPFGETRSATGTLDTDKLFTGQRLDDTGLYYYNARYYDATIGRFISADTIVPNYMNPQTLNRYSYCLNNPLKYVDPSGHDCNCDPDAPGYNPDDPCCNPGPGEGGGYGHGGGSYGAPQTQYAVLDANDNPIPGSSQSGPGAENDWIVVPNPDGSVSGYVHVDSNGNAVGYVDLGSSDPAGGYRVVWGSIESYSWFGIQRMYATVVLTDGESYSRYTTNGWGIGYSWTCTVLEPGTEVEFYAEEGWAFEANFELIGVADADIGYMVRKDSNGLHGDGHEWAHMAWSGPGISLIINHTGNEYAISQNMAFDGMSDIAINAYSGAYGSDYQTDCIILSTQ